MESVQLWGAAEIEPRRTVEASNGDLRGVIEISTACAEVGPERVQWSPGIPIVMPCMVVMIVALRVILVGESPADPASVVGLGLVTATLATAWLPGVCRRWISSHPQPDGRAGGLEAANVLSLAGGPYMDNPRSVVSTLATGTRLGLSARSERYGVVEASVVAACTVTVTAGLAWQSPPPWHFLVDVTFAIGLILLSMVDVSVQRIPSSMLSAEASVVGVLVLTWSLAAGSWLRVLGGCSAAAGAGAMLAIARFASGGGLGRGDVRLAALIGLVLGWHAWTPADGLAGSLVAAWAAVIVGGVLAALSHLWIRATGTTRPVLPFAPALSAGAVVVLLLT